MTKDNIILAAIEIISESGVHGLTTKVLAEKQKISESILYKHFKSLDDVLIEVVNYFARFDIMIENTVSSKNISYKKKIIEYIKSFVELYESYPDLASILLHCETLMRFEHTKDLIIMVINRRSNFIKKNVEKGLKIMVEAAETLAQGDINADISANTKDEVGDLAQSFRNMIDNIRNQVRIAERIAEGDLTVDVGVRSDRDILNIKFKEIVDKNNVVFSNVISAAEQVAAGSKQLSDSSMELSQGASEQAGSIEELTASIEEIDSQTKVNAQNAEKANDYAKDVKSNAAQGETQMNAMLGAMKEINESSANISKIIKVIDEIAMIIDEFFKKEKVL